VQPAITFIFLLLGVSMLRGEPPRNDREVDLCRKSLDPEHQMIVRRIEPVSQMPSVGFPQASSQRLEVMQVVVVGPGDVGLVIASRMRWLPADEKSIMASSAVFDAAVIDGEVLVVLANGPRVGAWLTRPQAEGGTSTVAWLDGWQIDARATALARDSIAVQISRTSGRWHVSIKDHRQPNLDRFPASEYVQESTESSKFVKIAQDRNGKGDTRP
jgi:hypothetical protein